MCCYDRVIISNGWDIFWNSIIGGGCENRCFYWIVYFCID